MPGRRKAAENPFSRLFCRNSGSKEDLYDPLLCRKNPPRRWDIEKNGGSWRFSGGFFMGDGKCGLPLFQKFCSLPELLYKDLILLQFFQTFPAYRALFQMQSAAETQKEISGRVQEMFDLIIFKVSHIFPYSFSSFLTVFRRESKALHLWM